MSKKISKNLARVQDMLDGNYKNKIQSGYEKTEVTRKVGEKWTDSDGYQWEQKNGYRSRITAVSVGLGDTCSECKKFIIKPWDRDVYRADGRCYHCQLNYELDLSFDKPIRWFAYRRLKDFQNMVSIEKDMDQWFEERHKMLQENPFDKSVANAMANSNVEMTINKNKSIS